MKEAHETIKIHIKRIRKGSWHFFKTTEMEVEEI